MLWGIDVYLELRAEGLVRPAERGALPLVDEVADAFGRDGLSAVAEAMRSGSEDGREAFKDALLAVVAVKRGTVPADGWLRYLTPDVLAPFHSPLPRVPCGEHSRHMAQILETREHVDPELRR